MTFTNDRFPPPRRTWMELFPSDPTEDTLATHVGDGTTIGARSVIGPGLELGRFTMVGMGSVVTRDVPDFHLVVGNPARTIGAVSRAGVPIARAIEGLLPDGDVICPRTGASYRLEAQKVLEL
ncbi:MAG: hypothetical protein R2715_04070 [Ilumatobacteraceae bacterium]